MWLGCASGAARQTGSDKWVLCGQPAQVKIDSLLPRHARALVRGRCSAEMGVLSSPRAAGLAEVRPRSAIPAGGRKAASSAGVCRGSGRGRGRGRAVLFLSPTRPVPAAKGGGSGELPAFAWPVGCCSLGPSHFPCRPHPLTTGVVSRPHQLPGLKALRRHKGFFQFSRTCRQVKPSLPGGPACFLISDLEGTLSGVLGNQGSCRMVLAGTPLHLIGSQFPHLQSGYIGPDEWFTLGAH